MAGVVGQEWIDAQRLNALDQDSQRLDVLGGVLQVGIPVQVVLNPGALRFEIGGGADRELADTVDARDETELEPRVQVEEDGRAADDLQLGLAKTAKMGVRGSPRTPPLMNRQGRTLQRYE